MNNSLIVSGELSKARRDLEDTQRNLTQWYTHGSPAAREEMLHHAAEALMRAVASVAQAVERLGELPECDHQCPHNWRLHV